MAELSEVYDRISDLAQVLHQMGDDETYFDRDKTIEWLAAQSGIDNQLQCLNGDGRTVQTWWPKKHGGCICLAGSGTDSWSD